ncbi:MAG: polyprenyl synthetase family protein [Elusimicrobia bacterium]|nr:polyprenyl synthetase family protein [Candidatus Obscuribacterium magneticum]
MTPILIGDELKEFLSRDLGRLDTSLRDLANKSDDFFGGLLDYVLINSGKRIRPSLVFLTSKLGHGHTDPERAQKVALAVEMIHIGTLVHDDVIDQAVLRRGKKTVVEKDGVETAVLLGDYLYTLAFKMLAEFGNNQIPDLMAEATSSMCGGEIEQLKNRFKFNLSEDDYMRFIRKKTASLFGAASRSGGILAGLSLPNQTALQDFGVHLGIAFQIMDDLLDIVGNEKETGKTLRLDILHGKMTLPFIHYRDHLDSPQGSKKFLDQLAHLNGQVSKLVLELKEAGSIEYSESVARQHVEKALDALEILPESPARAHLINLTQVLLTRKS